MPNKTTAVVSIIGRTNVGKSTLFNTLLEKRYSIISPKSGTTRDRNYQLVTWRGISFYLVDTGGLDIKGKEEIENNVIKQAKSAIAQSDIIIFMVDGRVGITKEDRQVAQYVKKTKKPIILVVNKIDSQKILNQFPLKEFLRLGFKNPLPLSAKNGSGTGDLLDVIFETLPHRFKKQSAAAADQINLAILGKPNVGKSSLVNSILGEERVIVTASPHTTRDPQNIIFQYKNQPLEIVDTAGVRKVRKIKDAVEKESVNKSMSIIKKADVILLVLDISQKISHQDSHLAKLITEAKKPAVLVANKWDKIPDRTKKTEKQYQIHINKNLPQLAWAPIVFSSATCDINIKQCLDLTLLAYQEYNKQLDSRALAQFMKKAKEAHRPTRRKKSSFPKLYSLRQVRIAPPTFALKIQKIDTLHPSYLRFLEKRLRKQFGFIGSPITITLSDFKF